MHEKRRVVVIGAGPGGSAAAMALARDPRLECLVLERQELPRVKVCGSGLSPWTLIYLDQMGVGDRVRERAYRIDGAVIAGRTGDGVELRGHHETAILERSEFDHLLAKEAVARGAELRQCVRVTRLLHDGHRLQGLETSEGPIEADVVIDASGAKGKLTECDRGGLTLHSILGWYEGVDQVSDVVELFFDRSVSPHYAWIFPESPRRVNIGLCFGSETPGGNARERFERFVDARISGRMRGARQIGKLVGHPIHVSSVPRRLTRPGVLTVGEAGRLVDSATAEGIYHALVSGTLAAEAVRARVAAGSDLASDRFRRYGPAVIKALAPRMVGGRVLMEALRYAALDGVLRFSQSELARTGLRRMFTGLYHG